MSVRALALAAALAFGVMPSAGAAVPTARIKVASFNVVGGGEYAGLGWSKRLPVTIDTMLASGATIFLLQEAHEERDEDRQILRALERRTNDRWVLVRGDGGNHFIIDGSRYAVVKPPAVVRLPYRRDYAELNLRHRATDLRFWVWNTHLIANSTSEGRPASVAQPMRLEQAQVIAERIGRLKRAVGGGDINDVTYDGVRAVLAAAGHTDVRTRVDSVVNGQYDSHKFHQGPNRMRGEWMDLLAAGTRVTVTGAGLIDSGAASDHNLIWTTATITG